MRVLHRSFPQNEWSIFLTYVQEPVYLGVEMEVAQTFRSHSEETPAKAKRGGCETTSI